MITRITADCHPLEIFTAWFDDAITHGEADPNAMALATVNQQQQANVRFVLYKGLNEQGDVIFVSNYHSTKGEELAQNQHAALAFYWPISYKQVRFKGTVKRMSRMESETYFASRNRESQLGAWASEQSTVIDSRDSLDQRYYTFAKQFDGQEVPCPPHWGGYLLHAETIEFWWGRRHRLHDRYRFSRVDNQWQLERLAP